ncbi:MAG: ABC transporter permease [Odoribacter sp.]|nr:ABC transporter permease [Odoribacter sp.]
MLREIKRLVSKPVYLFMFFIAPLFSYFFFIDLLKQGVPNDLPIAVVDEDNTATSRQLRRTLDAFGQTRVAMLTPDFSEARRAMQRGEIFGIFHIPEGFTRDASSGKQPLLTIYTNDSYILPGSLVYKDMRLMAALANGVVQGAVLEAKGITDPLLTARLMPISLDTHPLNNPWLSYSVYLANILIPAVFCMFVMFMTVYSITDEIKHNTAAEWFNQVNGSAPFALFGKLFPQFLVFLLMGLLYLVLLYHYQYFPLNSGFAPMFLAMILLTLASQSFAVFVLGLTGKIGLSFSVCALWSVLAFSITGFTFPVRYMAMPLQWFSVLFPMRHYYLIYVDQALNGIPFFYSLHSYAALLLFLLLPFLILRRFKNKILTHRFTA